MQPSVYIKGSVVMVGRNRKKFLCQWLGDKARNFRLCVNSWGKTLKGKLIKTSGDN